MQKPNLRPFNNCLWLLRLLRLITKLAEPGYLLLVQPDPALPLPRRQRGPTCQECITEPEHPLPECLPQPLPGSQLRAPPLDLASFLPSLFARLTFLPVRPPP